MLSVPVRSVGDDGNTVPDNDEQSRFDSLLQMQQWLERNLTQIRNQQNCLDRRIMTLNQHFVSMESNIRSIAQHSVCVEQNTQNAAVFAVHFRACGAQVSCAFPASKSHFSNFNTLRFAFYSSFWLLARTYLMICVTDLGPRFQ